jgi:2-polyprenyl-3-methyl-5-hydroxy-6-metoxy-1,4-benzoquinol methylase
MQKKLTERAYWDAHWRSLSLPVAHTLENSSGEARAILEAIEEATCGRPPRSVLEIGGAPGGFLAYFADRYGAEIHAVDYSEVGCRATEENFRLLGVPVHVHCRDLFSIDEQFPRFDLVYSLGFIEHFADTESVVRAHRALLNPNGLLILGVPHFVWAFWSLLQLFAPQVTQGHNRNALSLEQWTRFEHSLGLTPVLKRYLGGFKPRLMRSVIDEEIESGGGRFRPLGRLLSFGLRGLASAQRRLAKVFPGFRLPSIEGKFWSAYALAAYTAAPGFQEPPVATNDAVGSKQTQG